MKYVLNYLEMEDNDDSVQKLQSQLQLIQDVMCQNETSRTYKVELLAKLEGLYNVYKQR